MSTPKVKSRSITISRSDRLAARRNSTSSPPIREARSETDLLQIQRKRPKPKNSSTRFSKDSENASSVSDLLKSYSEVTTYPLKRSNRNSDVSITMGKHINYDTDPNLSLNYDAELNRKYARFSVSPNKCHSLITLKSTKKLNSSSSEDLIPNGFHFNPLSPPVEYLQDISQEYDAALESMNNKNSAIQLKRSYSFTSMATKLDQSNSTEPAIQEDQLGAIMNHMCENVELLLMDDFVNLIHKDNSRLFMNEAELAVYDLDIDSFIDLYDVTPLHKFEE